jgi:F0F1-type ATP synthase assembly protein I
MPEDELKKVSDREYYIFAFRIMGDFGSTIAIPVVLFVLIGQYLDGRYDKSPWFTVAGFTVAALITAKLIHQKAKKYGREYQAMEDRAKK